MFWWLLACAPPGGSGRTPLPKAALPAVIESGAQLTAKFHDGITMVAHDGGDLSGPLRACGVDSLHEGFVTPTLDWQGLSDLVNLAEQATGRPQPDFSTLFQVEGSVEVLANDLWASPCVEYVHVNGLAETPSSTTPPDHQLSQHGLWYDEPGHGFFAAKEVGVTGAGLHLADIEFTWTTDHIELNPANVVLEPGQTMTEGSDGHGEAAIALSLGLQDGIGIDGLAPLAKASLFPIESQEEGQRRHQAVANALAEVGPGGVALFEYQAIINGKKLPASVDPSIWLLVRTATDAGVTVVMPAGNGAFDLDTELTLGDSGAIMVGATDPLLRHERAATSNHGQRIDVSAWGARVVTAGYGDLSGDQPQNHYTSFFDGTSAASALVAAATLAVKDYSKRQNLADLSPGALRDLFRDTGVAGPDVGVVGPRMHLRNALAALGADFGPTTRSVPGLWVLTVTELYVHPTEGWVEITNTSDDLVDLNGVMVVSNSGFVTFDESFLMGPGQAITVGQGPDAMFANGDAPFPVDASGGLVMVLAPEAVDRLEYDQQWGFLDGNAYHPSSLDQTENDDPTQWCLGTPTPGSVALCPP